MPNAHCPMPNSQCPLPNSQCPIPKKKRDEPLHCWLIPSADP
ncbi:hypothetical protein [Tolypothrix sp. VBCCA 56010]